MVSIMTILISFLWKHLINSRDIKHLIEYICYRYRFSFTFVCVSMFVSMALDNNGWLALRSAYKKIDPRSYNWVFVKNI